MGVITSTDPESGIIKLEINGSIELSECLNALTSVYSTVGESSMLLSLVDLSNATGYPTPDETRELAAFVERNRPKMAGRAAFVAPSDAAFGVARMAEANLELVIPEIRVFRSHAEAQAWLISADDYS